MRSIIARTPARGLRPVVLLVALAALVCCSTGGAQAAEWPCHMIESFDGDTMMDQLGIALANGEDMDEDGYTDYIAGAPSERNYNDPPTYPYVGPGFVRVYSSHGDSLIFEETGESLGDQFGFSVAGGYDMDGDDPYYRPDFVVGAPNADPPTLTDAGKVYVFSGSDGSLHYSKDGGASDDAFGWSVGIAAPWQSGMAWDNYLVVGAPGADVGFIDNGAVFIYQAYDGTYYNTLSGLDNGDRFGFSVAGIGYTPGANTSVVVGAPYTDAGGKTRAGAVYHYNVDGTQIQQIDGGAAEDFFGYSVAAAGDINVDGYPDFIVGAPDADPGGLNSAGCVYVYSARDGSLLLQIDGTRANARLGISVAAAGDVNGDGWPDVMAGSQASSGLTAPAVVYSGVDGSPLVHLPYSGIVPMAVAGNVYTNWDGKADFLIGNPWGCGPCETPDDQQIGSVYLMRSGYGETIQSITDVGNDQGKQVRIEWESKPGNDNFVQEFAIYRRVDEGLKSGYDPYGLKSMPPGTWDYVLSVPARGDTVYSAVVATLADSTESEGTVWSAFFVSAMGENPLDHFDSPVDSGYSIDNLAPSPPPSLLAELSGSDVQLDWGAVDDADFDFYWVYRDIAADFVLDDSKRIGSTSDTSFLDTSVPGQQPYYKVCAVDFAGNESDPSDEATVTTCSCPHQCDYDSDGFLTALDLSSLIDVLFAGKPEEQDPDCPTSRGDFDNDGFPTAIDLSTLIDHLFAGGPPPVDPCA